MEDVTNRAITTLENLRGVIAELKSSKQATQLDNEFGQLTRTQFNLEDAISELEDFLAELRKR